MFKKTMLALMVLGFAVALAAPSKASAEVGFGVGVRPVVVRHYHRVVVAPYVAAPAPYVAAAPEYYDNPAYTYPDYAYPAYAYPGVSVGVGVYPRYEHHRFRRDHDDHGWRR
jgi:hypothetical protein